MTFRVLVYTRTADYRHDSIPAGIAAVRGLGEAYGVAVDATEDPAVCAAPLDAYAVVVFLSTSGDVLTPAGRVRLAAHIDGGGGFAGVHAAACSEYDWPYYGELLGARFDRHPDLQPGRAVVEDHGHPATRHLPPVWEFTDEWYDFRASPRGSVRVLVSADESSYAGGGMGDDHPLAWSASSTPPSDTPRGPTTTRTSAGTSSAASPGRRPAPEPAPWRRADQGRTAISAEWGRPQEYRDVM